MVFTKASFHQGIYVVVETVENLQLERLYYTYYYKCCIFIMFSFLWQNDKPAKFPQAAFLTTLSYWTGKNMSSYDIPSQNIFARTIWEFQAKISSAESRPECMASLIVSKVSGMTYRHRSKRCDLVMNRAIIKRISQMQLDYICSGKNS